MRPKKSESEYFFFPEGNIVPIQLSDELKSEFERDEIIITSNIRKQIVTELSGDQVDLILSCGLALRLFQKLANETSVKQAANYMSGLLAQYANKAGKDIMQVNITSDNSLEIIKLLADSKLTKSDALALIEKADAHEDITNDLKAANEKEMMSSDDLEVLINRLIEENPSMKEEMATRPEKVSRQLMGLVMKETKGQVNAKEANETISKIIK